MADDWHSLAACLGLHSDVEDQDPMFPVREDAGEALRRAKRTCAGCPVRGDCLADAINGPEPLDRFGVRGGLTSVERKAVRLGGRVRPCPGCGLWTATAGGQPRCRSCTGHAPRKPAPAEEKPTEDSPPPAEPSDPRCGTRAGISVHHRRGEKLCGPCKAVRCARDQEYVAARKAARSPTGYASGIDHRRAVAAELVGLPLSVAEVARRMGCTTRTARKYLRAAREELEAGGEVAA